MLQRNLVYTGVTRGKRLLDGNRQCLSGARARRRWSKLKDTNYPIEFITRGQTLEPKVTIVSSIVPPSGANGLMMTPSMPAWTIATT